MSGIEVEPMAKFSQLDGDGNSVEFDYGNVYFRQPCGDGERLVIGPSGSQIRLLDELSAVFSSEQYVVLYVLLLSHVGRSPGRYQSPLIPTHEDLRVFLWMFQEFFEGDGRHHVWIASPDTHDLLVYDQHNVIFGYGALDSFERLLTDAGFRREEFWFPSPHSHSYDPANFVEEDGLMTYYDWQYTELHPDDEWD